MGREPGRQAQACRVTRNGRRRDKASRPRPHGGALWQTENHERSIARETLPCTSTAAHKKECGGA